MSREYLNGIDKFHGDQATNEPYILASQAEQVWYVLDSIEPDWQVVVKMSQRGLYDMHSNDPQVEPYLSQQLEENIGHQDEDIGWVREGEGRSIITSLREVYKNKKYLPLDMCPKKTRAIRRRLTKRRVIRPFILRRKKDEVEKFLPGKTQIVTNLTFEEQQALFMKLGQIIQRRPSDES